MPAGATAIFASHQKPPRFSNKHLTSPKLHIKRSIRPFTGNKTVRKRSIYSLKSVGSRDQESSQEHQDG